MDLAHARRLALASLAMVTLAAPPARACGGYFTPADAVSTATDHRMVLSIGPSQTILWDQVRWSGAPRDFAWVLPTPQPATLELASEDFFDWLDAETRPIVYPPSQAAQVPAMASSGPSFGCGGGTADSVGRTTPQPDEVTVYFQGQVGPYQTATVGGSDASAIEAWLTANGYAVPPSSQAALTWYASMGWVFNVLRLRPDATTSQMQPVRVTIPGMATTLPLRMAAAGAGAQVGITIWVIAAERYATAAAMTNGAPIDRGGNYDTVTIDDGLLEWSTSDGRSNYRQVFLQTIAAHGGRAFVTESAAPLPASTTDVTAAGAPDLAAALDGQGGSITLTRLRTQLDPSLLEYDLSLMPSASAGNVSNQHYLTSAQVTAAPFPSLLPILLCVGGLAGARRRVRRGR